MLPLAFVNKILLEHPLQTVSVTVGPLQWAQLILQKVEAGSGAEGHGCFMRSGHCLVLLGSGGQNWSVGTLWACLLEELLHGGVSQPDRSARFTDGSTEAPVLGKGVGPSGWCPLPEARPQSCAPRSQHPH